MGTDLLIIQDIPTIHNNTVIAKIRSRYMVTEYYAQKIDRKRYNVEKSIAFHKSVEYGIKINIRFLWRVISSRAPVLLVGVMNPNTKLLLVFFLLLRRDFVYWTDLPQPPRGLAANIRRRLLLYGLKFSRCKIWCVGSICIEYFKSEGVCDSKLTNVPILVDVSDKVCDLLAGERVKIFTGSRLIHEKGFDLFIEGIFRINRRLRDSLDVVIVGDGPEADVLNQLVLDKELTNTIEFCGWIDGDEFRSRIDSCDIVVQPSRIDAFGLAIYGMAAGKVVIGTSESGAVRERVEHGVNGLVYRAEDVDGLASAIEGVLSDRNNAREYAANAFNTALNWETKRILEILEETL